MKFYDMDREVFYTLKDMKDYYTEFVKDDKEYCDFYGTIGFLPYMLVFIMDTINGRNNIDIVGLIPREIEGILNRIRTQLHRPGRQKLQTWS